jgi:phosphatidylserine/phosphatidylglycerophosphate/cardiolipin synthase-like enzyme
VCYSPSDVPRKLREHIESAIQSLWVSTAFLDNCGLELLKTLSGKGVKLRVLVSIAVSSELVKEISRFANVRVLEEKFMHAKIYIADGKALIGSPNLTCPVLEGKNIEVLCEMAAEEAIKVL